MTHERRPDEPSLGHPVFIGLLELDLHIPLCHSLKAKRGILARIMNDLRKQLPIVIAEVGDHDVWGRSGLAATTLSGDESVVHRVFANAVKRIEASREVELLHHRVEIISG